MVDNLFSADVITDKIYKHSAFSSVILDSFSSPSTQPQGLTWDGTNLYSADSFTDKIYKHDGFSSTITDSFSSPGTTPAGLAWDSPNLLSVESNPGIIYKHNGFSSAITNSFATSYNFDYGIAWDGTDLYVLNNDSFGMVYKIYKHAGFTSTITDSFNSPDDAPGGLTWDDTNILSSDAITDKIYKHDGFSSTILDSFSSPATAPTGLAWRTEIPPVQGGNYTQSDTGVLLDSGTFRGALRVYQDIYEAIVLSAGSTIKMGPKKLQPGIRIVGIILSFDALGAGVTLSVGDVNDDNRYIDAVSAVSAGSKKSDLIGGMNYEITGTDDDVIIIKTAGGTATGTIKIDIIASEE